MAKDEIETPPPLKVTEGTAKEQTGAAVRDVLLVASALPALLAVLGTRDVKQIIDFIGSSDFAPALGVIVAAGVLVWRQCVTRWEKRKLITAADAAPSSVATVVKK